MGKGKKKNRERHLATPEKERQKEEERDKEVSLLRIDALKMVLAMVKRVRDVDEIPLSVNSVTESEWLCSKIDRVGKSSGFSS